MVIQSDHMMVRTELIKTHDGEAQQKMEAFGRYRERYGGTKPETAVPRIQQYGFTAHAPKGSLGVTMSLDGHPDKAMMIGMEHPEYRPKNLAEGEWKMYTKWPNQYIYAQQAQWTFLVGSAKIVMYNNGIVHINPS